MEERRKLPRKYLMAFSLVLDYKSGELLGYLCDLTLEGLMVISKVPKDVDSMIELFIELPNIPNLSKKRLLIEAQIIWCEADIDPRLYNIGFQFDKLGEEDKVIIERMIEAYVFRRDPKLSPPSFAELNREL